jgi:glycosyltransferase involved in cell wall biosynthesis
MKVAFVWSVSEEVPESPRNVLFGEALLKRNIESVYYVAVRILDKPKKIHHRDGHSYTIYVPCSIPVFGKLLRKMESTYFNAMFIHIIESFVYSMKVLGRLSQDQVDAYVIPHLWDSATPLFAPILNVFRPVASLWMGASPGILRRINVNRWVYYAMVSYYRVLNRVIHILVDEDPELNYYMFRVLKSPKEKVHRFNPCIVDEKVFYTMDKREAAKKVGFDTANFNILSMSRIVDPKTIDFSKAWNYQKNIFWVIEAFRGVAKENANVHLHITGLDQGGIDKLTNKIAEYRLQDKVTVHGWINDDLRPYFINAADLVTNPSRLIEFNIEQAIFEAFLCGKPVVAFKRYSWVPTEQPGGFLIDIDPKIGARQFLLRLDPAYLTKKSKEAKTIPYEHYVPMMVWGKRLSKILAEMFGGK